MKETEIYSPQFHAKLRKRNKEAFQILYEEFKIPLYNLVYSMTRNKEKTADVIQDTFIKVIKKIHQLQDPGRLKYWIFRIAVNITINQINKEKRLSLPGDDLQAMVDKTAMDDFQVKNAGARDPEEIRYMILELVEQLPVKQQLVFNLKYIEGFKETEIAEIADVPVGTVKSRLNIARNRIKLWLKREL